VRLNADAEEYSSRIESSCFSSLSEQMPMERHVSPRFDQLQG